MVALDDGAARDDAGSPTGTLCFSVIVVSFSVGLGLRRSGGRESLERGGGLGYGGLFRVSNVRLGV